MTDPNLHPLAQDYLRRLRRAGRRLPPERLSELSVEIEAYLSEAIASDASDHDALGALERLGSPGEIVEAEDPSSAAGAGRRGWRAWAAVILLPVGGFVFGVGWLVGLVLLWSSRLWTTREKLIGTLIVPGGIASTLLVLVLTGTKRRCTMFTTPLASTSMHCNPSGGPSAATTALQIALVAFFVLAPLASAAYLAYRARPRPAMVAISPL